MGSGRNRTSCQKRTAFTAQRRHQPILICTSRIVLPKFHYSAADVRASDLSHTHPVRPGLRSFWRKREVLIPNGARPSISLRTSAQLLSGYVSVFGGRLGARCSYASGVPFALQAMPIPRSVNLPRLTCKDWRSGEVSIPTRCRAASFQSPLPSRRRPLRIWRSLGDSNSIPSASEADALFQ